MKPLNIAIAGGGLLGRLCAWRLLRAGHKVSLYEAGSLTDCPGAAATAAGMISPLAELVDSEPTVYILGMQSLKIWPQWLEELSQTARTLFHKQGSIVVAHSQDCNELKSFTRRLQLHQVSTLGYSVLDEMALHKLEPELKVFNKGLYLHDEAHIENQELLPLLLKEIIRLGGKCKENFPIHEINVSQMKGEKTTIRADWHLDCRGIGAKHSLQDLRGVRGEVLWVSTKEISLKRPVRLLHPRYKLYIVPKPKQQFIIGATEIESEDLSPISLQSTLELSSALYSLNPAFSEARVIKSDVNLRPSFSDNLPKIHSKPGYININGLYRHGYLLAPALINIILKTINTNNIELNDIQKIISKRVN